MDFNAKQERFQERRQDFIKCVHNLDEAVQQPTNSFIQDSVIKRFVCNDALPLFQELKTKVETLDIK